MPYRTNVIHSVSSFAFCNRIDLSGCNELHLCWDIISGGVLFLATTSMWQLTKALQKSNSCFWEHDDCFRIGVVRSLGWETITKMAKVLKHLPLCPLTSAFDHWHLVFSFGTTHSQWAFRVHMDKWLKHNLLLSRDHHLLCYLRALEMVLDELLSARAALMARQQTDFSCPWIEKTGDRRL